ncbi:MAG: glycosyltransferase family 4 protein [Crocinitomicaceae bacterium]|nr:glycosyltransferase family 4 protein [Crocinitomicaceae bacterium]
MKVLFLSHKPPYPIVDGGCHAMDRMLRDFSFSYPNATITYLSLETEKHPSDVKSIPPEFGSNIDFINTKISTRINPIAALIHLFNSKSYNISRFKKKSVTTLIKSLISKKEYDVVVFESLFAGAYVDEIKNLSKAKLIYRAHNIEHKIWEDLSKGESNPLKKRYLKHLSIRLKTFELTFLKKVNLIMSISEMDQSIFTKNTNTNCKYIPVSMPSNAKYSGIKNSLCFLGAFNWMPNKEGISWYVNTIHDELVNKFPKLNLEIAGSFSDEISNLSEKPNIRLHGFVDSSMDFISSHGIFIAPILSGSGVKMKVLEAMSLGVPCVLSKKAAEGLSLPSVIPVCNSKEEFIEKLSLLLVDEGLCEKIGLAGQEFIQKEFSTDVVSKKLITSLKL